MFAQPPISGAGGQPATPLPSHTPIPPSLQARRLWGDVYFQPRTRGFKRKPPEGGGPRTFVQFVLEPLYKLVTLTISEPEADVRRHVATPPRRRAAAPPRRRAASPPRRLAATPSFAHCHPHVHRCVPSWASWVLC